MSPRRAWAVARKEFLHIVRDLRSLSMALALPLFIPFAPLLFRYSRVIWMHFDWVFDPGA